MDENYLIHYGVRGMHWGVRRYQNYDGSYIPGNEGRYAADGQPGVNTSRIAGHIHGIYTTRKKVKAIQNLTKDKAKKALNHVTRQGKILIAKALKKANGGLRSAADAIADSRVDIGKKHADTYLKANIMLKRIQTSADYDDNFAFFATYKKHDADKYAGLFGHNLRRRAMRNARLTSDPKGRKQAVEAARKQKIYQLSLKTSDKMKVASEDSAIRITSKLLTNKTFKSDLKSSIRDASLGMRRPQQIRVFNTALRALNKTPRSLTRDDKKAIYDALNMSLTWHDTAQQRNMQKTFYSAMKKNGYSAIVDVNDRKYSSYHAKSPVIVFDTSKAHLSSVTTLSDETMNRLNRKYTREIVLKEIPTQTINVLSNAMTQSISAANNYVDTSIDRYIRDLERR